MALGESISAAKLTYIYQLGDHDPSGVDAWQGFARKVRGFAPDGAKVTFDRLVVTRQQITDLQLPTRPTKASDTRSKRFEGESVEVDAIPARRCGSSSATSSSDTSIRACLSRPR